MNHNNLQDSKPTPIIILHYHNNRSQWCNSSKLNNNKFQYNNCTNSNQHINNPTLKLITSISLTLSLITNSSKMYLIVLIYILGQLIEINSF